MEKNHLKNFNLKKEIEINPEYAYESFWDEEKYYWEEAIKGCHWKKIEWAIKTLKDEK